MAKGRSTNCRMVDGARRSALEKIRMASRSEKSLPKRLATKCETSSQKLSGTLRLVSLLSQVRRHWLSPRRVAQSDPLASAAQDFADIYRPRKKAYYSEHWHYSSSKTFSPEPSRVPELKTWAPRGPGSGQYVDTQGLESTNRETSSSNVAHRPLRGAEGR